MLPDGKGPGGLYLQTYYSIYSIYETSRPSALVSSPATVKQQVLTSVGTEQIDTEEPFSSMPFYFLTITALEAACAGSCVQIITDNCSQWICCSSVCLLCYWTCNMLLASTSS